MRIFRRCTPLVLIVALTSCASAPQPGDETEGETYQLGLLRKGPTWTSERNAHEDSLQAGHLRNMQRMYDRGLMIAAGPFEDGGERSGLFIFGAASVADVEREAHQDPKIHAGRLVLDLHAWHAPLGIGEPYKRRFERNLPDSMLAYQFGLAKQGPQWQDHDSPASVWRAHDEATARWIQSGELAITGPLIDAGELVAVMVFKADSATARRLVSEDPAVEAGAIAVDFLKWWTAYGTMPGDTL